MGELNSPLTPQPEDHQIKGPLIGLTSEKESDDKSTIDISTNYEPHSSNPTSYTVRITDQDGQCTTIECKDRAELVNLFISGSQQRH